MNIENKISTLNQYTLYMYNMNVRLSLMELILDQEIRNNRLVPEMKGYIKCMRRVVEDLNMIASGIDFQAIQKNHQEIIKESKYVVSKKSKKKILKNTP